MFAKVLFELKSEQDAMFGIAKYGWGNSPSHTNPCSFIFASMKLAGVFYCLAVLDLISRSSSGAVAIHAIFQALRTWSITKGAMQLKGHSLYKNSNRSFLVSSVNSHRC